MKPVFEFKADIYEWPVPNTMADHLKNISRMYADHYDKYVLLHIKPKSKRMHQKTYDKLLAKLLNVSMFTKEFDLKSKTYTDCYFEKWYDRCMRDYKLWIYADLTTPSRFWWKVEPRLPIYPYYNM